MTKWLFLILIIFSSSFQANAVQTHQPAVDTEEERVDLVLDKRRHLDNVTTIGKIRTLFPLPRDRAVMLAACESIRALPHRLSCLDTLAQGYYEGIFEGIATDICLMIHETQQSLPEDYYPIDYHQRCLCYKEPNLQYEGNCLEAVDQKAYNIVKEAQLAGIPVNRKLHIDSPTEASSKEKARKETILQVAEIVEAFILGLDDRKHYYRIYTPDSYAFQMFSNTKFSRIDQIKANLSSIRTELVDTQKIKLSSTATPGVYIYLVKHDGDWWLDTWTPTKELRQLGRADLVSVKKVDNYIEQRDSFLSLISHAIQVCQQFPSGSYQLKNKDCPMSLYDLIARAYVITPENSEMYKIIFDFVDEVLSIQATAFNHQFFVSQEVDRILPQKEDGKWHRVAFIRQVLLDGNITQVKKIGDDRYQYFENNALKLFIEGKKGQLKVGMQQKRGAPAVSQAESDATSSISYGQ